MKKEKMFLIFVPLILGVLIYILYRSSDLFYFRMMNSTFLYDHMIYVRDGARIYRELLSTWVVYSLPDGLWLFSFGAAILIYRPYYKFNVILFSVIYVIMIIIEFIQKYYGGHGTKVGTYDLHDIVAFTIAYLSVLGLSYYYNGKFIDEKKNSLKKEITISINLIIIFFILGILPSLV